MATGVLPILIGRAVKASDYVMAGEKRYVATLRLGITTDTEDITGEVLSQSDAIPGDEAVCAACAQRIGRTVQIPPMYSAIKIDGRKLVDLAREGREVERAPREIFIRAIRLTPGEAPASFTETPPPPPDGFSFVPADAPCAPGIYTLDVTCAKGTYIRTLCADIGKTLGCGGVMASLCRVRSGSYTLTEAYTTDALEALSYDTLLTLPQPVETLFSALPEIHIPAFFAKLLRSGTPLYQKKLRVSFAPGELVRVYTDGTFLALGVSDTDAESQPVIRLEKLFLV